MTSWRVSKRFSHKWAYIVKELPRSPVTYPPKRPAMRRALVFYLVTTLTNPLNKYSVTWNTMTLTWQLYNFLSISWRNWQEMVMILLDKISPMCSTQHKYWFSGRILFMAALQNGLVSHFNFNYEELFYPCLLVMGSAVTEQPWRIW